MLEKSEGLQDTLPPITTLKEEKDQNLIPIKSAGEKSITGNNSLIENKERVYRYQLEVFNGEGLSFRNTIKLTEFFIPFHNICFNQYGVFKAENPRNISLSSLSYRPSEPVTSLMLSTALISEIIKIVELKLSPKEIKKTFANNEEFQSLFTIKLVKTVRIGNEIKRIKGGFWERYEEKGNNVIKNALVKYVMDGIMPERILLNDLYDKIAQLSQVEKQSIIDAVQSTLSLEDGKLTKRRQLDIEDQERGSEHSSTGLLAGVGGGVIFVAASKNPIFGIGIGFFSGYAASYVNNEYQKYQINRQWDQREIRGKQVIDTIEQSTQSELTFK